MEPLAHYAIPTLFLLALNPKTNRRRVLLYSPLALFPDLDFFFGHAFLHNIFAVAIISIIVYYATGKSRWAGLVSAYFLSAHLVLDLGFVALLYPLKANILSLNVKIYTSPASGRNLLRILSGEGSISEELPGMIKSDSAWVEYPLESAKTSEVAPVITQLSLMLMLISALALAFSRAATADGKKWPRQ
jgi:hypothetical protein